MNARTAALLIRLNREFYQRFAAEFAESRSAIWPGIRRALEEIRDSRSVIDIGCGDGRTAQAMAEAGWAGEYVGVDFSEALIERARRRELASVRATFVEADVTQAHWTAPISNLQSHFDAALCFALLHHIPGHRRRLRLLREIVSLVRPGGRIVISTWQFLSDARLRRKIAPWRRLGLSDGDVEADDYLLDWKRAGEGLRYVCALGEAELRRLARAAGCKVIDSWQADGRTGALSLYVHLHRCLG